MKIIVPISESDAHLLDSFLKVVKHFGGLEHHTIILAPVETQLEAAQAVRSVLVEDRVCPTVIVKPFHVPSAGWPIAPNMHFGSVVEWLAQTRNQEPWLWLELDAVPVKPNWASTLAWEYASKGKAFMGFIRPTVNLDMSGRPVTSNDDVMMMGTAVYAPDFSKIVNSRSLVEGLKSGMVAEPFDKYLRHFLQSVGWTHSKLIGDRWMTGNYRVENGEYACDNLATESWMTDHSKTDISEAVIIHGVKDSSLADIILSGAPVNQEKAKSKKERIDEAVSLLKSNGYVIGFGSPVAPELPVEAKSVYNQALGRPFVYAMKAPIMGIDPAKADSELTVIQEINESTALGSAVFNSNVEAPLTIEQECDLARSRVSKMNQEDRNKLSERAMEIIKSAPEEQLSPEDQEMAYKVAAWRRRVPDPSQPFPDIAVIKFFIKKHGRGIKIAPLMQELMISSDDRRAFGEFLESHNLNGKNPPFWVSERTPRK